MGAIVRPAVPADAGAIARAHVDSFGSTYAGILPDEFLAGLTYEKLTDAWVARLRDPEEFPLVFVSEDDPGSIFGFLSGGPERKSDPLYQGEIYAIYILKEWQRQGIGRRLVAALAGALYDRSIRSMLVWVLTANPACKFYEKLGGIRVREKELIIGDRPFPGVAYAWDDILVLADPHAKGTHRSESSY